MNLFLYFSLIFTVSKNVHTSFMQPDTELTNLDLKQVLDLVHDLNQKYDDLQRENQALKARVHSLEANFKLQQGQSANTNTDYQSNIKEQTDQLDTHETWRAKTMVSEQDLSSKRPELNESQHQESNSKTGQRSSTRRQLEPEDVVAFYAGLSRTNTYQYGQNIIFDNVTLNIGTHYIKSHGIFVAPTTGIYVFSVTLMTSGLTDTHAAIYINEKLATRIKLYGSEHAYDTMSQTPIYQLNKMDAVSVKHTETNKTIHGYYTYFSGFLLSPIFPMSPSVIG